MIGHTYRLAFATEDEVREEAKKKKEEVRDLLMNLLFGKEDK